VINGYTESEICMLYREAKNKDLQITILSQLTGLQTFEIERILQEGGYNVMADLEKLKELHAAGLSMAAIGKELGIKSSTVSYHMEKLGLEPNGKGRKKKEESKVSNETREPIKDAVPHASALEELKEETKKNVEELKKVLPKCVPDPDDLPIDYDIVEELSPQQFYELTKLTLELLKAIWGA